MATYAIGDVQGCYHSFQHLLRCIRFDASRDSLWLVGDVINRGTGSLPMLRWLYEYQAAIVCVLGNHDLHVLAVAEGLAEPHRSDTVQPLLDAPDSDQLLCWLRHQRMIHFDRHHLMVHAGLLPQWDVAQAMQLGAEVETALRADGYRDFLAGMYGNHPASWTPALSGMDRLRLITNAMTRLRVCTAQGEMDFKFKGKLEHAPLGYLPWFAVAGRRSRDTPVICGHWSMLGLRCSDNIFALDSGCLWGGELSALRLQDHAVFQVPCDPRDSMVQIK